MESPDEAVADDAGDDPVLLSMPLMRLAWILEADNVDPRQYLPDEHVTVFICSHATVVAVVVIEAEYGDPSEQVELKEISNVP